MFFLFGWRYPWVTFVVGLAVLIAGLAIGKVVFEVIGCVGVAVGGYRCIRQFRRRGMTGGWRGMIGGGSNGNRGSLL